MAKSGFVAAALSEPAPVPKQVFRGGAAVKQVVIEFDFCKGFYALCSITRLQSSCQVSQFDGWSKVQSTPIPCEPPLSKKSHFDYIRKTPVLYAIDCPVESTLQTKLYTKRSWMILNESPGFTDELDVASLQEFFTWMYATMWTLKFVWRQEMAPRCEISPQIQWKTCWHFEI